MQSWAICFIYACFWLLEHREICEIFNLFPAVQLYDMRLWRRQKFMFNGFIYGVSIR